MSFHVSSTRVRSAAPISGRRESGASGSAAIPASRVAKCSAMRAAVAGSKSAVAYSSAPDSPPSPSSIRSIRSNGEVPGSASTGTISTPGRRIAAAGAPSSTNRVWKTTERPGSRSGRSSSTSRSNGSSSCAYAPSAAARTRRSASRKVGSPSSSARSASVLAKKPTTPSVSARPRLATGVPTTTSVCPV